MTRTIIPGGSDELTGWTMDGIPIDVTGRRWITRHDWRRWPMLGLPSPEAILVHGPGKGVEPEFDRRLAWIAELERERLLGEPLP